jgi:hypothetical protein
MSVFQKPFKSLFTHATTGQNHGKPTQFQSDEEKKEKPPVCHNCHRPVVKGTPYCNNCGQIAPFGFW